MINSDDVFDALSSIKVVVFMETDALTDRFQQIVFTKEQAKLVRDAIAKALDPSIDLDSDDVSFNVVMNEEVAVTLPNIRDFYGDTLTKKAEQEG